VVKWPAITLPPSEMAGRRWTSSACTSRRLRAMATITDPSVVKKLLAGMTGVCGSLSASS
jgi:hypothetical protein